MMPLRSFAEISIRKMECLSDPDLSGERVFIFPKLKQRFRQHFCQALIFRSFHQGKEQGNMISADLRRSRQKKKDKIITTVETEITEKY